MLIVVAVVASVIPMIPAAIYWLHQQKDPSGKPSRKMTFTLTGANIVFGLMVFGLALVALAAPSAVSAAVPGAQAATPSDPYAGLAAALSAGLAAIAAGMAVNGTGSAAVATIAEKPEAFGRSLVFVGLAEGIAIYGLIIAFMVLRR